MILRGPAPAGLLALCPSDRGGYPYLVPDSKVPGTWCLVLGTWYSIAGTWYLVPAGTWYLVPGTWYHQIWVRTISGIRYVYVGGGKCLFIKGSLRGGSPSYFPGEGGSGGGEGGSPLPPSEHQLIISINPFPETGVMVLFLKPESRYQVPGTRYQVPSYISANLR